MSKDTKDSNTTYGIQCGVFCLCQKNSDEEPSMASFQHNHSSFYRWCFVISIVVVFQFYYNTSLYLKQTVKTLESDAGLERSESDEDLTSFRSFMKEKNVFIFKNLGAEEIPKYSKDTPFCKLNLTTLGPIKVNKTALKLEWVEQQNPDVQPGGFYAPPHCRSRHKVAILVPYRNREINLALFLYYIHPFLKKQLLEYRIFVIEEYGTEKFNKGSLYNIAFLETQRFGDWHCLVFHDVDLLPLDERILYSCPRSPTHMSSAVESQGYQLPYPQLFGGVTVMSPVQFQAVNGYSNAYWDWGAEDDDMFVRLQAKRYKVLRYNKSIGRYAHVEHERNSVNDHRYYALSIAKRRFRREGLKSIMYKLVSITKNKLYTHILADVNPFRSKV